MAETKDEQNPKSLDPSSYRHKPDLDCVEQGENKKQNPGKDLMKEAEEDQKRKTRALHKGKSKLVIREDSDSNSDSNDDGLADNIMDGDTDDNDDEDELRPERWLGSWSDVEWISNGSGQIDCWILPGARGKPIVGGNNRRQGVGMKLKIMAVVAAIDVGTVRFGMRRRDVAAVMIDGGGRRLRDVGEGDQS